MRTDQARRSAGSTPRPARSTPRPATLALPPRRAIATIVATALGLVLLFSFKTPEGPDSIPPAAVARGTAVTGAASPFASVAPRTSSSNSAGAASSAPAASAPPINSGNQQVDGDVVGTRFGDVQVRLVEAGGKITDVQALQLPFDRRRSNEISQYAEPILHSEALQAQSAQIDTVSGATYTSDAYRTSLQSALDHVHG
ncbi:MAG TPA: FMN-binding protein [Candidatus Limnocylindrales bacterium]